MRRKFFAAFFLVSLFSCGAPEEHSESSTVDRIVSLSPATTEILFNVGAGDRVVGATNYCNYPEETSEIARIGDFAALDLEKILELEPDLVVTTTDGSHREVVGKLRKLEKNVVTVDSRNFNQVLESIRKIGKAVGKSERATAIASSLEEKWSSLEVNENTKPRVLLLYGISPLVAAGGGSLGDEMISHAGGKNIFGDSGKAYVTIDYEEIIHLAPEVIIQVAMGTESNLEARRHWGKWSSIPAVKSDRIFVLDADIVTRPGPRIVKGLELVRSAIWNGELDK